MNPARQRIVNAALRMSALLAKLTLVIGLAFFLPADEVAMYGIVSAVVLFGVYAVGLDFYTHANREMVSIEARRRGTVWRSQWTLYAAVYLVVLCAGVVAVAVLPGQVSVIAWIVALLLVEHQAQEVNRLLVVLDDQLAASGIMFLRAGAWGLLSLAVFVAAPDARHITTVFALWFICSGLAVVIGSLRVRHHGLHWRERSDRGFTRRGLRVAVPFFAGTVALNAMFTLDRFLVGHFLSVDAVAAYTLFVSVAGALRSVLDAGVFSFSLPRVLAASNAHDILRLRRLVRRLSVETALIGGIALVVGSGAGWLVTAVFLDDVYLEYFWMLPVAIAAFTFFGLCTPPQQVLYALRRDQVILATNLAAFVCFVLVAILASAITYVAAPLGLLAGFVLAWVIRIATLRRPLASTGGADPGPREEV